jgi:hypothetical protein
MSRLPFALAFLSFAIYAYAIQRVFSRDHGVDWRMRMLQIAGAACSIVHLHALWSSTSTQPIARIGLAMLVYGIGLAVFFAARSALTGNRLTLAFSSDTPAQLVKTGYMVVFATRFIPLTALLGSPVLSLRPRLGRR